MNYTSEERIKMDYTSELNRVRDMEHITIESVSKLVERLHLPLQHEIYEYIADYQDIIGDVYQDAKNFAYDRDEAMANLLEAIEEYIDILEL